MISLRILCSEPANDESTLIPGKAIVDIGDGFGLKNGNNAFFASSFAFDNEKHSEIGRAHV